MAERLITHVGQQVMVRHDLEMRQYGNTEIGQQTAVYEMVWKAGNIVTIKHVCPEGNANRIVEDGWNWSDDMFIPIEQDEESLFTQLVQGKISKEIYERLTRK